MIWLDTASTSLIQRGPSAINNRLGPCFIMKRKDKRRKGSFLGAGNMSDGRFGETEGNRAGPITEPPRLHPLLLELRFGVYDA